MRKLGVSRRLGIWFAGEDKLELSRIAGYRWTTAAVGIYLVSATIKKGEGACVSFAGKLHQAVFPGIASLVGFDVWSHIQTDLGES